MSTTATLVYTATKQGPITQAQLETAMAAVALDETMPTLFGATLTSDVTNPLSTNQATRTIVFNISSAAFQANFPTGTDQAAIFHALYTSALSGGLRSIVVETPVVIA